MNGTRFTKWGAFVACLLMVLVGGALAVGACGGGETASGTTPPPASPSSTASTSQTASLRPTVWASPRPAVSYSRAKLLSTETLFGPGTASNTPRVSKAGTIGWEFSPTVDIEVTALGCFDAGRDGLARAHRVGIFDKKTRRLLASVTVRPKSRLEGSFRWESLKTPLILEAGLEAGSYLVGTEDKGTLETLYTWRNWPKVEEADENGAPRGEHWAEEVGYGWLGSLRLFVNRPWQAAFRAPTRPEDLWNGPPWFSPNFKFKPVSASSSSATPSASGSGSGQQDKLVWRFETGAAVHSTPAASGGAVYVGNDDGHLYAVDIRSGRERWGFTTGGMIRSALAVADGAVYCRSYDGYLHAVDIKSGRERWAFAAGDLAESSPAVGDGRVYLAVPSTSKPDGDDLYALDGGSGRVIWKATTASPFGQNDENASPAVSRGVVYYGVRNLLYAFDGKTGQRLWKSHQHVSLLWGTPAVARGLVYTRAMGGGMEGVLQASGVKSGDRQWRSSGPTSINSPAVGGGTVYVVRGDGTLLALNGQTGSEEWRSRPGLAGGSSSWAFSSPAVGGGEVCVSSDDGWLHAVDADTGRTAWRFSTGAGVLTSPVISNGVVYVGSDDGYLYAVKE